MIICGNHTFETFKVKQLTFISLTIVVNATAIVFINVFAMFVAKRQRKLRNLVSRNMKYSVVMFQCTIDLSVGLTILLEHFVNQVLEKDLLFIQSFEELLLTCSISLTTLGLWDRYFVIAHHMRYYKSYKEWHAQGANMCTLLITIICYIILKTNSQLAIYNIVLGSFQCILILISSIFCNCCIYRSILKTTRLAPTNTMSLRKIRPAEELPECPEDDQHSRVVKWLAYDQYIDDYVNVELIWDSASFAENGDFTSFPETIPEEYGSAEGDPYSSRIVVSQLELSQTTGSSVSSTGTRTRASTVSCSSRPLFSDKRRYSELTRPRPIGENKFLKQEKTFPNYTTQISTNYSTKCNYSDTSLENNMDVSQHSLYISSISKLSEPSSNSVSSKPKFNDIPLAIVNPLVATFFVDNTDNESRTMKTFLSDTFHIKTKPQVVLQGEAMKTITPYFKNNQNKIVFRRLILSTVLLISTLCPHGVFLILNLKTNLFYFVYILRLSMCIIAPLLTISQIITVFKTSTKIVFKLLICSKISNNPDPVYV